MAEDVADDFRRHFTLDLSRRERMSKHVSPEKSDWDLRDRCVTTQSVADRTGAGESIVGQVCADEQSPSGRVRRSHGTDIDRDGLGDRIQQRERDFPTSLWPANPHDALAPMDIIERQREDLAYPQAIGGHEKEQRAVAAPSASAWVDRAEDSPNVIPGSRPWRPIERTNGGRRHERRHVLMNVPGLLEIAEEGAESAAISSDGLGSQPGGT